MGAWLRYSFKSNHFSPHMMQYRKVVFTKPNHVEVQTDLLPEKALEPNQVFLKNRYSVISPGTELACLSGRESWFPLPNTPGYVGVGEVIKTGANVAKVAPGDKVFTYGPHAEYYTIDTTDRYSGMCLKVPGALPLNLVPFTRLATIPFTSIRVSNIELGDWVVVMGLGIIGNFAAQLAQLQGANVIGVDVNEKRCAKAQACGIRHTVNSATPGWKEEVRKLARNQGISTLIDATGLSAVIVDAVDLVAPYGEAILLGSPRAEYVTNATSIFNRIHLPGFTNFKGALEWRYPTFKDEFVKHSIERNSEIVMDLILEGKLNIKPLFTHEIAPEKAPFAYKGLKTKPDEFIGVVFNWNA
jgi:2-desacetyl-2-hydroxyethyl bacteriochlorophyllide A dehydrogenase